MLVAMAGLPGTGKSTLGEILANRLGVPVVSVDPIESAILSAGIDDDQPTGLAAYLVAETLADIVLASGRGIVIDAVNAVAPAREQWVRLAEKHGVPLRFVESVCSDPEVHRTRFESRTRDLPHLADPAWHHVEQTLDEWEEWGGPSAAAPRITVDSILPIGVNVDQAIAFLRG